MGNLQARLRSARWFLPILLGALVVMLTSIRVTGLGAQGPTLPPDDEEGGGEPQPPPPRDPYLTVGPVEGFTTAPHRVADPVVLPLATRVPITVHGLTSVNTVRWEGAKPVSNELHGASFRFDRPGWFDVEAVVDPGSVRLACRIRAEALRPHGLPFEHSVQLTRPFALGEGAGNAETVGAYFGHLSIGALHVLDKGDLATSIGQTLLLQARPRGRSQDDALTSLLEWRLDGRAMGVGRAYLMSSEHPGRHRLSVGPPSASRDFALTVYSVSIRQEGRQGRIREARPLTFTATTDPPGLEHLVTWLAATKHGSAEPTLGRGRSFTSQFDSTYGASGEGLFQWLGVRADSARLGQDDKLETVSQPVIRPPGIGPYSLPCTTNTAVSLPSNLRLVAPAAESVRITATRIDPIAESVAPSQVFTDTIRPLIQRLNGLPNGCFDRGAAQLSCSQDGPLSCPDQIVLLPQPNVSGVTSTLHYDLANYPELVGSQSAALIGALNNDPNTPATPELDAIYQDGMGMTVAEARQDVGRRRFVIPFKQVHSTGGTPARVPVEHAVLQASGWEGQSVTMIQGTLIDQYNVANQVVISPSQSVTLATQELLDLPEITEVTTAPAPAPPVLVLLPYDADTAGVPRLRYAYRMTLGARVHDIVEAPPGQTTAPPSPFQGDYALWLDAETGEILKLIPLFGRAVSAQGLGYKRDPGVLGTAIMFFMVDDAVVVEGLGLRYKLQLANLADQVRFSFGELPLVSIDGTDPNLANFTLNPDISNRDRTICRSPQPDTIYYPFNAGFHQVNLFGNLYRYHQKTFSAGIFAPFPTVPWSPSVAQGGWCNASAGMQFGACSGFFRSFATGPTCPDYPAAPATPSSSNWLSLALDNTVIAHELGHNLTARLTIARPEGWCCGGGPCDPACPIPEGWTEFHDIADAWADHLENTNCMAGWAAKNTAGYNTRLYCATHDEGSGLPRLHSVSVPFNPAAPLDHFPEHRLANTSACGEGQGYADGQMLTAALWQVRAGMYSKLPVSVPLQYGPRYQRALMESGLLPFVEDCSDFKLYERAYDLLASMTEIWATSSSDTGPVATRHDSARATNKVVAGFARAGWYLTPPDCLDGGAPCPGGDHGADAVVDVDDMDPMDDLCLYSVTHREWDYLQNAACPIPRFHVWTGPAYWLDASGLTRDFRDPAPCNQYYRVELSTDAEFDDPAQYWESDWTAVDIDPSTDPDPAVTRTGLECYAAWSPAPAIWEAVRARAVLSPNRGRLFYRVRTSDIMGLGSARERLSTLPGNGTWVLHAPFAIVSDSGIPPTTSAGDLTGPCGGSPPDPCAAP